MAFKLINNIMKTKLILLFTAFVLFSAMKNDKAAYQLFNSEGKQIKYKKLLKAANEADIILFGELHNNPICHWLQLELTKDLFSSKNDNIILGAEMFESDNQLIINEYLSETIKKRNFEKEARLWPNYETDYKPLLEFAKENKLKFVATNIPRRYASVVHYKGFEALNDLEPEAKSFIAPLPIEYDPELPGYKKMMEMMGKMGGMGKQANDNIAKAQASKDATMAYFILKNLSDGKTFIHFNGTYHSDNFEGISWYLKRNNPDLKILTIASIEQDSIKELNEESKAVADFILCIPEDMTKTY